MEVLMEHVDAKAIRERLNAIVMALTTLESTATAGQLATLASAREAVREIALLVTGDEADEHGQYPPARLRLARAQIREEEEATQTPAAEVPSPGRQAAG